ncbi:hypothetical protein BD309DRAFT_965106 [Dichomitus squalens]|nr:hypothetical protein BD309DRAFT_965106 [Dichomitus squalens]
MTTTASKTIYSPIPRQTSTGTMLNSYSIFSPPVQGLQALRRPPVLSPLRQPNSPQIRRLLYKVVVATISQRLDRSKSPVAFPSPSGNPLQPLRSSLTTTLRHGPISVPLALQHAQKRLSHIYVEDRAFGRRPKPSRRGKRLVSKLSPLYENETHTLPPTIHNLTRQKTTLSRSRFSAIENTIPFPTETPPRSNSIPKGRKMRAVFYSVPRQPFAQL